MDANTILELVRAGYTKDEIAKMAAGEEELKEGNETVSEELDTTDQAIESEVMFSDDISKVLKPLQEEIAKLGVTVKAIQDSNIKNASTDSPKKEESIKEIMDGFINQL